MKEKDIIKVIKDDIKTNTPNILNKINLDDIEIEPVVETKRKPAFNLASALRLSLALGVLIIGLVITYTLTRNNNGITKLNVTNKDKVVASYAITGVNIVSSNNQNLRLTNKLNQANDISFIDEFHKFFYLVEDYLELNKTNITITTNNDNEYNYKMVVTVENIFNETEEYVMYYNENREIDDDEEEKTMVGILIYNQITYNFKSEEEVESDESEIKVIIYKNIYANRIEIEKEFESNEYQYEYTIYESNKEIITIELEVEDNEMEFKIETNEDEHEYIIEKISDNQFKIIYDEEITFHLTIDINNKSYTYNYNNQNIVK